MALKINEVDFDKLDEVKAFANSKIEIDVGALHALLKSAAHGNQNLSGVLAHAQATMTKTHQ